MDTTIPPVWRRLSTTERDILVTLAQHDATTGTVVHDLLGGTDAVSQQGLHAALKSLREKELIESPRSREDKRARLNQLSPRGAVLVREAIVTTAEAIDAEALTA